MSRSRKQQYEQLSLFDIEPIEMTAVSCFDGVKAAIRKVEVWMERIIPGSEYVVDVGKHPLVLKQVKITKDRIPQGHEYYHYMIGKKVYSGTFVGTSY